MAKNVFSGYVWFGLDFLILLRLNINIIIFIHRCVTVCKYPRANRGIKDDKTEKKKEMIIHWFWSTTRECIPFLFIKTLWRPIKRKWYNNWNWIRYDFWLSFVYSVWILYIYRINFLSGNNNFGTWNTSQGYSIKFVDWGKSYISSIDQSMNSFISCQITCKINA